MILSMKLSIIIPVYNEERTLEEIIRRVEAVRLPDGFSKEIIVVDDCSTDKTGEILKRLENKYLVIRHALNCGKGSSVIDGLKKATGDVMVIQDADLEYSPEDYNVMLRPILDGKADVVYGSRLLTGHSHRIMYFWHYLGNKFLTLLSNIFTNLNLTDMETCYKMFTREVNNSIKEKLASKRFGIEPEITAMVKKYRIYEVGISYAGRVYKEGKKINWKDGISAVFCIVKFNIFPSDYRERRKVFKVLFFLGVLILLNLFILPPKISSDSNTYLKSMRVLETGIVPPDFIPNRIMTTFVDMKILFFLRAFTGNIFVAWMIFNIILFIFGAMVFYFLLKSFFKDSITAFLGTALLVTNYAMLSFGLSYLMDMGGWAFYIACLYASFKYLESKKDRYLLWAAAMVALGGLLKEYAFLGYIVILGSIFWINWGVWKKILKNIFVTGIIAFLPTLLIYSKVYFQYSYSYLNWFGSNSNHFGVLYHSRAVEFIKALGSLYNIGWLLFLGGLYYVLRNKDRFLNKEKLIFLGLVFLSALPIFEWPAITQRILFITMPFVILISSIFIAKHKNKYIYFSIFILAYLLLTYTMDSYVLPLVNIDGIFKLIF